MVFWFDYMFNGFIVGNIYVLFVVGFVLIFGVLYLINFVYGLVYMVGVFIGWLCLMCFGLLLFVVFVVVVVGCGVFGIVIEWIGLWLLCYVVCIVLLFVMIGISFIFD